MFRRFRINAFNRTMLELKFVLGLSFYFHPLSFNRTMLELKLLPYKPVKYALAF